MSVRLERVAKAMRQEIGGVLAHEMNDPRIGFTTVTRVEPAADIRSAKVYVSIFGDEKAKKGTMAGIKHAKGYLQREVASRLRLKFTPTLSFFLDDGPEKSVRISELIDEVLPAAEDNNEEE